MFRLLVLLLLLTSTPALAQELETVCNRSFQVKYEVPAHWHVTRQRTDSVEVLRYHNPDNGALLWVGQLRGQHAALRPALALQRLLRHLGAVRHEEHNITAHGLDFLESIGTCVLNGRELRYDARVTNVQGQQLLVHVYAVPVGFASKVPLLHYALENVTPLRSK